MQRALKNEASPPVGRWGAREAGIIEVASRLFADKGYDSVTMAAVAGACGLSEGTLYNYFRDKSDLAVRACLVAFERHADEAEEIVANARSLRAGLEQLTALELRILIESRGMMRIWLREVRGADGYPRSAARHVLRRFSGNLIALFKKWQAMPDAATGLDLSIMRDIFFGSAEHIVGTAIVQHRVEDLDVEKLARDLASAYLRAFDIKPVNGARKGVRRLNGHQAKRSRSPRESKRTRPEPG